MSGETVSHYLAATAALLELPVPPECEAGVLRNLELLLAHARTVAAYDDPALDPAELLLP